jgi:TonB-linked SusC/RagA family outer membrane protein
MLKTMKKSTRYLWSRRPNVSFNMFKLHVKILVLLLFCGLTVNAYPLSTDNLNDLQQQRIVVSGKVTDPATGDPMIGVNIMVKGTTIGTISDASGKFALPAAIDPNSTLVFTFIGYSPKEVPVQGKSFIDVTMASDITGLKEVVVTALGISKEKKSLAYSVSDVKTEDLVKAANNNLMKSLDGKISGVNLVSLSSDPTSSVLVNIRGTSLMPSAGDANVSVKSQPLYVIDGIPVGNQGVTSKNGVDFGNILSQLNPEDIENITILKGGSAGALYGSEGGNGVVMITTKSGKGGRKGIGVSFSTSATMEQPYQFIEEQSLYGQGERAFEWQYDNTDTWGPALDGSYTGDFWNTLTQKWDNGKMVSANENRLKAYLQTGSTITTNINISGNYDKGAFRLSFTDMGNKGVMPNTATNQKSFTLNSEYKLTDKIKISANAAYVRTYSPNKANVDGSNSIINRLLFNFPANLQPLADMKNYWMKGFEGIIQNGAIMKDNGIDKSEENPWWSTYEKINHFTRDNFFGKLQLDWQLNKDFAIMLRSGMDNIRENYEYRQSFGNASISSRATGGDGQFQVSNSNTLSINSDAIITFNKNVGKWDFSAAAGTNYTYTNGSASDVTASALTTPGLFTLGNVFPSKLVLNGTPYGTVGYGWGIGRSSSVYATADLGWNKQFFIGVTGRNDWKGNLNEEKIHYFYPSVSAAWVVSETFKLPEVVDLLKIRLGLADIGNGLTKLRPIDTYSFESPDWSGSVKTAGINATLVDPKIKPMHSVTKEIGLDLWMFKKRVNFDFTYFIKDQNDQIGGIPLVPGTGFSSMTTNIGNVRNKGFEWGLTVSPVSTQNWNWDVTATFTHYKSVISKLSSNFAPKGYVFASYDGKTVVKIAEGEEIGNIYEQNPILRVKTGKYAGMPLLDGDAGEFQNSPLETDRAKLGNYNPDYILGLNSTLRYKGFSLNVVGSFRKGGKYISVNQQYMESNGRAFTTLSSGDNNPWWKGGRTPALGGMAWPLEGSSDYESINNNNDGQRSDFNDASYAKGVFLNPDYSGDPAEATDADYIVNGADPNNTFYQIPYNSYGDVIWNFTSTRTYDATNFKLREVSITYTVPGSLTQKLRINHLDISLFGRNVLQWNKSGRNEDPESAFSGVGTNQGILRATLPSIRSLGFKLAFDF